MGYIDVSYQTITFFISVALGVSFCIFYDILRVLHKNLIKNTIEVFISDLVFWCLLAVITFFFLVLRCNGQLRVFVILGITAGFISCRLLISRLIYWVFNKIVSVLVAILHFVSGVINKFFIYINKLLINSMLLCKKLLQPKVKLLYNQLRLKCGRKGRIKNGSAD